ncbi:MAG: hypothetical protein HOP08_08110 [Cyclobacteriaceae bacterium]|nr:hypothetical protein [Cyclobacteriaceae bacterium]
MKTTQFSTPIVIVVTSLLVFNAYQASINFERMSVVIIISSVVLASVGLLFYKLDIAIDSERIFMKFGIGLIRKTIPLEAIADTKQVKNSFFAGWGLRYHAKYTLYNASSQKAVELSFKDKSMKIRIGTRHPEEIIAYLSSHIHRNQDL